MILLSIDPGLDSGVAVFDGGELVRCGIVRQGATLPDTAASLERKVFQLFPSRVVVEVPQVYVRRKAKGDPNQLVALAFFAGCLAGRLSAGGAQVVPVSPHSWKGTIPKTKKWADYVIHLRVAKALREREDVVYTSSMESVAPGLRHNVADAVGIGLHHLGRLR